MRRIKYTWKYPLFGALSGRRALGGKVLVLSFCMALAGFSIEAESGQKTVEETACAHGVETLDMARPSSEADKENFKKQNLYCPLQTKTADGNYEVRGSIYLSDHRTLTVIEAQADTQISMKGTITRVEGDIKILYKDSDGTIITLADSQDSENTSVPIDTVLNIKKHRGEIYFSGSCIYDFDIKLETSDNVKYYLN